MTTKTHGVLNTLKTPDELEAEWRSKYEAQGHTVTKVVVLGTGTREVNESVHSLMARVVDTNRTKGNYTVQVDFQPAKKGRSKK